jgi:hypothetical protein
LSVQDASHLVPVVVDLSLSRSPASGTIDGMRHEHAEAAIRQLVERYRAQCLWFLRPDFVPQTADDVERVLQLIERYGDLEALRQVAAVRRWLSPPSSASSVSC